MSIKSLLHHGQQTCARIATLFALSACLAGVAQAADSMAIIGKNEWLFARHEIVHESLSKEAQISIDLIAQVSRMLEKNNVALAVTVVPSKMDIYPEQLPDDFRVTPYMSGFNDSFLSRLRAAGVQVIDLKKSLRDAALRDPENPVFYRLDTHWTHSGALVAAQTVQAGIAANPGLKKAFDATSDEAFQLNWAPRKVRQNKMRDVVNLLPAGAPHYGAEETRNFSVMKKNRSSAQLLGDAPKDGLTLLGSSFSGDWSGFPDAMRFALQRNLFNFYVNADAGPWMVMRIYLQNDAFQSYKPKLLIWEIPERSILTPNYPFRQPRYRVDNLEWLLQVAALTEPACEALAVRPALDTAGLRGAASGRSDPSTREADYVEVNLDQAVDASGYLSARLKTDGSQQITLEAWDRSSLIRKFTLDAAGDDREHALKTPLSLGSKGVTRLKIYPGNTNAFSLKDIKICRYQENWAKNLSL